MNTAYENLVNQIRKEERAKILKEIELEKLEKELKPFTKVSKYIDRWGERNDIPVRDLVKIKESIYTVIRYSLNLKRMPDLKENQVSIAEFIAYKVLNIIQPVR